MKFPYVRRGVCKGKMMSKSGRGLWKIGQTWTRGGRGSKIPEILRTSDVHGPEVWLKCRQGGGQKFQKFYRCQLSTAPIYFYYMFPMVPMVSKRGSCSAEARMSDIPCAEKQIWWSGGSCIFFCARVSNFSATATLVSSQIRQMQQSRLTLN